MSVSKRHKLIIIPPLYIHTHTHTVSRKGKGKGEKEKRKRTNNIVKKTKSQPYNASQVSGGAVDRSALFSDGLVARALHLPFERGMGVCAEMLYEHRRPSWAEL